MPMNKGREFQNQAWKLKKLETMMIKLNRNNGTNMKLDSLYTCSDYLLLEHSNYPEIIVLTNKVMSKMSRRKFSFIFSDIYPIQDEFTSQ